MAMSGYGIGFLNNLAEIIFFCSCLYYGLTHSEDSGFSLQGVFGRYVDADECEKIQGELQETLDGVVFSP